MIATIKSKTRALVGDLIKVDFQIFSYTVSSVFKIAIPNVTSLSSVLKNGAILPPSDYSYDSDTQEITITASLVSDDKIQANFSYCKYSDNELEGYIRAALVYLSVFAYCSDEDYELEDSEIVPTPDNKTTDLISLIASILIKPNYSQYSTANLTVRFPKTIDKDTKIERTIQRYKWALGNIKILEF